MRCQPHPEDHAVLTLVGLVLVADVDRCNERDLIVPPT